MLISDDTEVTSPTDRATLLAEKFKNNFNTVVPPLNAEDMMAADPANCPADLLCSEDHILDIILSLDTNNLSFWFRWNLRGNAKGNCIRNITHVLYSFQQINFYSQRVSNLVPVNTL